MQSRRPDRCNNKSPSSDVAFSLLKIPDMISPLQKYPKTSAKSLCGSMAGNKINDGGLAKSSSIQRPVAPKIKKKLRFNAAVHGIVFETGINNHQRIWYSPEECLGFRETIHTDVRFLRSLRRKQTNYPPMLLSDTEQAALDATPIQGIEHLMCKKILSDRGRQQQAVIDAVLAEQQRQRAQGRPSCRGYDSDKLALVSSVLSLETRHRALADGRRCADEVIFEL